MNLEELHMWWEKVTDIPLYGKYEPQKAESFFTMPEYFDEAGIMTWEAITAAEAYGFGSIGVGAVHKDTVWPSLTNQLPQITEDFTGKQLDNLLEDSNYQITRRAGILQLAKRKIDAGQEFRLLFIYEEDAINKLRSYLLPDDSYAGLFERTERIIHAASKIIPQPENMSLLEYCLKLSTALWAWAYPKGFAAQCILDYHQNNT